MQTVQRLLGHVPLSLSKLVEPSKLPDIRRNTRNRNVGAVRLITLYEIEALASCFANRRLQGPRWLQLFFPTAAGERTQKFEQLATTASYNASMYNEE